MSFSLDCPEAYAAAGVPVFPVNLEKKPLLEGGFHIATTDLATIESWYRPRPQAGIGVPMGPAMSVP